MSSFHSIMTFSACKYSHLWLGYCLSVFAVISKALLLSCFINDSCEVEKIIIRTEWIDSLPLNLCSFLSFSFTSSIFSHELDEVSLSSISSGAQLNCDTFLIRNLTVLSGVCFILS